MKNVYLNALFRQVLASAGVEVGDDEAVADGLDRALHGDDAARALGRHVQVVGDCAGRHLQHVVRRAFVQKDAT